VKPRLGCKRFDHAAVTIAGIEPVHHISKDPFDVPPLGLTGA
jgi:hypothetical protein